MDDKDMTILKMLRENSRVRLRSIARVLGMSETGVKKRIDKLKENGVIRRFTVQINERAIGFARAVVCLRATDTTEAATFINKLPFISSVFLSSGTHNIIVEIEGPEGLVPSVLEQIKNAGHVKKASCSTILRRL